MTGATAATPDATPVLVLDACVLMSGVLRPVLLDLAQAGLFSPAWTERIGSEWRRNAARLWPIAPELLADEWTLMQERFPSADRGDVSSFESGLQHCDRKDWHVAAAGIACANSAPGTTVNVVTWNIRDFSRSELRRQGVGLLDPDRLFALWWPTHANVLTNTMQDILRKLIAAGRREPESLVDTLRRERLFRLAGLIERNPVR